MEKGRLREVRDRLDQVSPSFCLAKWKQVTLHLFNGNTQSCHHVQSHRVPLGEVARDPGALHNSKCKQGVRAQMRRGEFPKECRYCWNVEKVGEISDRIYKSADTWAWPSLKESVADIHSPLPSYLEVAFSNSCNFKCMYCSPVYSSLWEQEIREHGPYPTSRRYGSLLAARLLGQEPLPAADRARYVEAFWKWWPVVSPHLQHLRVTGGEPFLSSDTWRLLDSLIENPQPQLTFSINSNMGMTDDMLTRYLKRLESLHGKVKKATLHCSLDSMGAQAEYIRFGLKFPVFQRNLRRLLSESRMPVHVSFMVTVNALSLPGLVPLIQWIASLRREFPRHEIGVDTPYLRLPQHLSVFILPKEWSRYIFAAVAEMERQSFSSAEINRLERIGKLMDGGGFFRLKRALMRRDFVRMLSEHDRRRGTDFRATFPEYREFFSHEKVEYSQETVETSRA